MSGWVDRDRLEPRTRRLLEAPIVPTLVRLGAPNVLIMLTQASVGLIETFFVGKLGIAFVEYRSAMSEAHERVERVPHAC
jgi:hypothetical protein